MKTSALIFLVAMIAIVGFGATAQGQVYFRNVGRVGTADVSLDIPFYEGQGEFYVFAFVTSFEITTGSGHGMMVDTMGSVADTELAMYGAAGYGLVSGNDDGSVGSWGDPGYASILTFGDAEHGDDSRYQGNTRQDNPTPWNTELPQGGYVLVVGTWETTWDEVDARLTTDFHGRSSGSAVLNAVIF